MLFFNYQEIMLAVFGVTCVTFMFSVHTLF